MSTITANMVKTLRERTGAGMMDCKKALQEENGNVDAAIENMRKSGAVKAAKRAGRIAAEGGILIRRSEKSELTVVLEVNTETDFAAKDSHFKIFCQQIASCILENQPTDLQALSAIKSAENGQTIEEMCEDLICKIGEKVNIRRFALMKADDGLIGHYLHGSRIGVLVKLAGGTPSLAEDIAMHIAAMNPSYISKADVPQALLEKERTILATQAKETGKAAHIIEKIVAGQIKKFLAEITLLQQTFVKDLEQKQTIEKLLAKKDAVVKSFVRYEVGEGIEKQDSDFVAEVRAQAQQKTGN